MCWPYWILNNKWVHLMWIRRDTIFLINNKVIRYSSRCTWIWTKHSKFALKKGFLQWKHSHCLLTSYQVSWGPEIRAERRQIPFSQTHTPTPQHKQTQTHKHTKHTQHTHKKNKKHTGKYIHTKLVHLKKKTRL